MSNAIDEMRQLIEDGIVTIAPGNITVSPEEAKDFFRCADVAALPAFQEAPGTPENSKESEVSHVV
jgi:hypothetical protein